MQPFNAADHNKHALNLQQPEDSRQPCTYKEFIDSALRSMPPVEGDTEEERLDAAFERTVRAFIKGEPYFHRFDSPEQQEQEMVEILSARGAIYQIAEPEHLEADRESALVYLKDQHSIDYKTAKGLMEAIDALNVWLQSNREEIQKWRNEDPYPRQMLVDVEYYAKQGMRCKIESAGAYVNPAEHNRLISAQNLEMFVRLLAAKDAWDARTRRKGKRLSNKS